jgi:histidyl-tRNA synthetase
MCVSSMQVLDEILTELDLGCFTIKLNHRKLLDAVMAIAGVPPAKFRAICSAIDKLDKESWSEVRLRQL